MSDIEIYDNIEMFNYVCELDKKISQLQTQLCSTYFNNIKDEDLQGDIDPPLLSTDNNDDFQRINREIKMINHEIRIIDKRLCNLQIYNDSIVKKYENKNLSKERLNQVMQEEKKKIALDLQKQKNKLEEKVQRIKSNPKAYLRFLDMERSDFAMITDPEIKKRLQFISDQLLIHMSERDRALKQIKKKDKGKNLSLFKPKKDKKN